MRDTLSFADDFHLAIECIEGKTSALAHLQETYRELLLAFLQKSGALPHEAQEIVSELWSDCIANPHGTLPKLARYNGACALRTFLSTITLNNLVTRRRRENRWKQVLAVGCDPEVEQEEEATLETGGEGAPSVEAPLLELMREAIQAAFMACPPEDFVLLQLARMDDLYLAELAVMFGRPKSTIDRDVRKAAQGIAAATLHYIKETDPWLELKWEDFIQLCSSASPACFGLED